MNAKAREMFAGILLLLDSQPSCNRTEIVKHLLFVCSANRLRSPTAEHIFSTWPDVETDSAGLNASAEQQLSTEQVEWADIIFVMEKSTPQ
jgi:predicted protein tyrosine phosphatase